MSRLVYIISQILGLAILGWIGNIITDVFYLPIPGALTGMLLLWGLFETGILKVEWFDQGATILISELLLFFIPSAIGIMQYNQLFSMTGLLLFGVVVFSIAVVLAVVLGSTWGLTKMKRKGYKTLWS